LFEDRLKQLRIEKHLNMKQASIALGMAYTTYVSYEKNEREPNSEILVMLANFFDCSVDYLIGRTSCKNTRICEMDNVSNETLSTHEKTVIVAYRNKPEMQPAVDKLLGVADDEMIALPTAARSVNNRPAGIEYISQEKLERIRNAKSVEDEVEL
jgi:transcriptional regulator with XRE-family HTH domain